MAHTKFGWATGDLIDAGSSGTKGLNNLEEQYDDAMAEVNSRLMFHAQGSTTGQQISNSGVTPTVLSWEELYDNGDCFNGSTFTPPVAGHYLFGYCVNIGDALDGEMLKTFLYRNEAAGPPVDPSDFFAYGQSPPSAAGYSSHRPPLTVARTVARHVPIGSYVNVRAHVYAADVRTRLHGLEASECFWGFLLRPD